MIVDGQRIAGLADHDLPARRERDASSAHVGGVAGFSNTVVDAFAHLGVTHLDRLQTSACVRQRCHGPGLKQRQAPVKVQLERSFPLPAGPDAAWSALTDIAAVAACMPGAQITEQIDARHYRGMVTVRVGPATLAFRGEFEVREQDPASRTLRIYAKGTDTSGSSTASLDLTARVEPAPGDLSCLIGASEASVSGRAATFGGRMMDAVADQILKQFAANFAARVAAVAPATTAATAAATLTAPAASELNGLKLLWAIVRAWLRGLLAKKAA